MSGPFVQFFIKHGGGLLSDMRVSLLRNHLMVNDNQLVNIK